LIAGFEERYRKIRKKKMNQVGEINFLMVFPCPRLFWLVMVARMVGEKFSNESQFRYLIDHERGYRHDLRLWRIRILSIKTTLR